MKLCIFLFVGGWGMLIAQDHPIKINTEELPNRLAFYALNESEIPFDVMMTIEGTDFRQSKAKPRFIRVPAASRVHMNTIVLMRGKKPNYTYKLEVSDSLSGRSLRRESEKIKIKPPANITLYLPSACVSCDTLVARIEQGPYRFEYFRLDERPEIRDQLQRSLSNTQIDSIPNPIVNLGGKLHLRIETYEQLLEALKKE